ncbi:MAG: hypothetical protein IJ146_13375, partial [Kiritimatiellae bacterium]|nr:hypothetical protein [Kiritimatiellia bacterium]
LPKWAGAVGESGYGADLRDTYRSSAKIAARLAEYIKCWEYWNEPDSWPFGRGPAENLSAGQKALCLGIRSTGMGLPVAMAPPSSIASRDFIADCFENGIAEAFDIYNTHVYSLPEGYPGIFRAHEALLAQHGCSGSARIISEAGSEAAKNDAKARPPRWANEAAVPDADPDTVAWELLPDDVRAEVTMTYVKCWTLAAAYGWSRFYSFCFAYYNEAGGARVWGMLGPGMIATSSFAALAAFNTHVGSRVCQGEIAGLPRGVKGWLFSDGITHTGVCWAERKTGIAFPHVRKVAAMTGDVFAKPPRALDARPVFVEFSAPPPVVPGTAPSTISVGRPDAGGLSPIILDFVRDTSAGRFRVDNHRRHILTRLGERIGGRLHIYNFDSRPFEGDVRGVWPAGWRGPEAFRVSVPPMGRVTREVSFEAPQTFFRSAARMGFDADGGRSRTRATFLCAGELNAERVCALTSLSTKGVDANRLVCTNGVLDYTFQGKTLCSILSAAMPPEVRDADGVTFRLARVGGEGGRPEDSFSYIDVVAMTRGGKSARLSPNIFPVFLDDVREICYTIRFDELTPQVAGDEIETIQLRFNRFGAGKGRTIISDFCLWREKSGRKAEGLCQ